MTLFAHATRTTHAGLTLALCFETLGDLHDPKLTEAEGKMLVLAGVVGARECGEELDSDSLLNTLGEFEKWWAQDHVQPTHVFDSLVASAQTLKKNWKTGKDGHVRFLQAIMALGAADGKISDTEKPLPGLICGVMGIDQATYDRARQELFGR